MKLNAEQALDILERFDFFQGQRAGRELWNSKPFDVQEEDIAKFSQDVTLLKNYIKELTEENEKLTINMNAYGLTAKRLAEENEKWKEEYQTLFEASEEEIERLKAEDTEQNKAIIKALIRMGEIRRETKADTVRKMQERLMAKAYYPKPYGMARAVDECDIDQIAKEMLESGNE